MGLRVQKPMYWIARILIVASACAIALHLWNGYRLSRDSQSTYGHVTSVEVGRHGYKYVYYCYEVNEREYCDRLNIVGVKDCESAPKNCVGNLVHIDYLPTDPSVHEANIDW